MQRLDPVQALCDIPDVRKQQIALGSLVSVLMIAIAACGDNGDPIATGIELLPDSPIVSVGSTTPMLAMYLASNGTPMPGNGFSWSVADGAIATVASSCNSKFCAGDTSQMTLKGVTAGATTLTVSGADITATFRVTVVPAAPSSPAIAPP